MRGPEDSEVQRVLKGIRSFLHPLGFRRNGQLFGRATDECWHVIGIQKSRNVDPMETRLTVNVAVTSKRVIEFREEDTSKAPREWKCPIRRRIGHFAGDTDLWWTIRGAGSAQSAQEAIIKRLELYAVPFLESRSTNESILRSYERELYGLSIDRDEVRIILLASSGDLERASELAKHYEIDYTPGAAVRRATLFLQKVKNDFPILASLVNHHRS